MVLVYHVSPAIETKENGNVPSLASASTSLKIGTFLADPRWDPSRARYLDWSPPL